MRITIRLLSVAVLATLLAYPASAAGPFNLFNGKSILGCGGCDAAPDCDTSCCDSGCDSMGAASTSYLSLSGGWTSLYDYSGTNDNIIPVPPTLEGSFDDGFGIGFACGKRLNQAIRAEFEFAFRNVAGEDWNVNGATGTWDGDVYTYSFMANLLHDFNGCKFAGITPYVGGGIGLAIVDGDLATNMTTIDLGDEAFAYQFIAGGSKALNSRVEAFAEYRYFALTETDVFNQGTGQLLDTTESETDNIFFGIRINR